MSEQNPHHPKGRRGRRKSRPQRWQAAVAKVVAALDAVDEAMEELVDIRAEYEDWRDALPENLEQSPLGEKLEAVCDLEFGDLLDDAREILDEAENIDLPLGFGRD